MSSLIVQVCRVGLVTPHPDADRLDVAHIKGWCVCVAKGQFREGDKCVYFPPDCVMPQDLSDRLNITKYLTPANGGGRVRVASLRGFKSYGTVMPCENPEWEVGTDVAAHYGITKWEPPMVCHEGDAERPHPAFHRYYDMENIRNFPNLFAPGEQVVVTEKIHGQNCRLGLVREANDNGQAVWRWMAGSHDVRRKRFHQKFKNGVAVGEPVESAFWKCFSPAIREFLAWASGCGYTVSELDGEPPVNGAEYEADVVIFGERYGSGVQDMEYGLCGGESRFLAFDCTRRGNYTNFSKKIELFAQFGVEMVPVLYIGPFDFAVVAELADGPTTICESVREGRFGGREGVVVTSRDERKTTISGKVFERTQAKCISFAYLSRRGGTEGH